MSEKDTEEQIKKLTEIHNQLANLINEYNAIAHDINFEARVGLIDAYYEFDENEKPKDIEEYRERSKYSKPNVDILFADDYRGWFPSGLNC